MHEKDVIMNLPNTAFHLLHAIFNGSILVENAFLALQVSGRQPSPLNFLVYHVGTIFLISQMH